MTRPVVLPVLLLVACAEAGLPGKGARRQAPAEGFVRDETVRIVAPGNGAVVDTRFAVEVEAGAAVALVRLRVDGSLAEGLTVTDAGGAVVFSVEAAPGRRRLLVEGVGADGAVLSTHPVTVVVEDGPEAAWVAITSPADGATVANPVTFAVEASPGVDAVELFADGWSLGRTEPGGLLTYRFEGVGFPREIEAVAWDGAAEVAVDALTVTVDPGSTAPPSSFNARVLGLLAEYPTDGSYGYDWPESGSWGGNPHDLRYDGALFSAGDPQRDSFCVGLTFEVFLRAAQQEAADPSGAGRVNDIPFDDLYDFRDEWFVRELLGAGPADAAEIYGIGAAVTDPDAIAPGDFIQWWRHNGSGHNAVFLDWERDGDGEIIGFTYWSTQSSTDGISENTEYFGASGGRVDPAHFTAARIFPAEDRLPWR
jgi:hypothetical protein